MHGRHAGIPVDILVARLIQKFQRVEPAGAADGRPFRHACRQNRDQPVNVEQRHDVQAMILPAKPQAGGDVAGRCHDVALQQGHHLGPGCGPRCMKHQRLVTGVGGHRVRLFVKQPESPGRRAVADHRLDHRNRQGGCGLPHRIVASRLDDHQLWRQILEIEGVFAFLVSRVERGRRDETCHGKKGRRHLRPVRKDDGHPVAPAKAARGKLPADRIDMLAQRRIGHGLAVGSGQRDGAVSAGVKKRADGHGRDRLSRVGCACCGDGFRHWSGAWTRWPVRRCRMGSIGHGPIVMIFIAK